MDNYQIADSFSLLAKLMDLHSENSFKAKSYAIAAFNIEKLPVQLSETPTEKLFGIKGIGESTGKKVIELFKEKKQTPSNNFELTDGEKQVLKLLAEGNSVKLIADELFLSQDAIKSRIKKIYEKLHVRNMGEAVAKAMRYKIVE